MWGDGRFVVPVNKLYFDRVRNAAPGDTRVTRPDADARGVERVEALSRSRDETTTTNYLLLLVYQVQLYAHCAL